MQNYLRKGAKVYVEGQLATRRWQDAEKQDRYATEIVLKGYSCAIELLDRKPAEARVTQSDDVLTDDSYSAYADEVAY